MRGFTSTSSFLNDSLEAYLWTVGFLLSFIIVRLSVFCDFKYLKKVQATLLFVNRNSISKLMLQKIKQFAAPISKKTIAQTCRVNKQWVALSKQDYKVCPKGIRSAFISARQNIRTTPATVRAEISWFARSVQLFTEYFWRLLNRKELEIIWKLRTN